MDIIIPIKKRIAYSPTEKIVCGNSDYQIVFQFDEEWDDYPLKTARFAFGDKYIDVVFEGNICPVPVMSKVIMVAVGVFAGDLRTTTPALIGCLKSILCEDGAPADPPEDVYHQLMKMINMSMSKVTTDGNSILIEMAPVRDDGGDTLDILEE